MKNILSDNNHDSRYHHLEGVFLLFFALMGTAIDTQAYTRQECEAALEAQPVQRIEFGNFAPNGIGSVTVTTSGTRSSTGPILLGGTVNAGIINVRVTSPDCHCYPLRIRAVPLNGTADLDGPGTNTMPMSNIVTNPITNDDVTLTTDVWLPVYIGADLAVDAAQAVGTYNTPTGYTISITFRNAPGNRCPF